MEDKDIISLFWKRSESEIYEISKKYGKYCHYIAYNILYNEEDSEECVLLSDTVEEMLDEIYLVNKLNCFLESLPRKKRIIFMRRYWYMSSVKEICADFHMSESKVKMMLMRLRNDLRLFLEEEGIRV